MKRLTVIKRLSQLGVICLIVAPTVGCRSHAQFRLPSIRPSASPLGVCISTDWYRKGIEDGRLGHTVNRFEAYRLDCKLQKIILTDKARYAYDKGLQVGRPDYCTVENGYKVAKKLRSLQRDCPCEGPDYRRFLKGEEFALREDGIERAIILAKNDISDMRRVRWSFSTPAYQRDVQAELIRLEKKRINELKRRKKEIHRAVARDGIETL